MDKKYWALVLDNFEDKDDVFYCENYEIAKANFDAICEKYKDYEDFAISKYETSCHWYDPRYNEYDTYVTLCRELELPIIDKVIF